jgi:hypothetical protein
MSPHPLLIDHHLQHAARERADLTRSAAVARIARGSATSERHTARRAWMPLLPRRTATA